MRAQPSSVAPACTKRNWKKNFIKNASNQAYTVKDLPSNNIENFLAAQSQLAFQFHVSTEKSPENYSTPTSYILAKKQKY
jgi:hypothetical protein